MSPLWSHGVFDVVDAIAIENLNNHEHEHSNQSADQCSNPELQPKNCCQRVSTIMNRGTAFLMCDYAAQPHEAHPKFEF